MKKFLAGSTFYERPWLWKAALAAALPASFGLRMINLKDPPLDFAGTRQLFSALKAHGIYYEYVTDVPEAPRAYGWAVKFRPLTALGDWKHILLAIFTLPGLQRARAVYDWMWPRHLKRKG